MSPTRKYILVGSVVCIWAIGVVVVIGLISSEFRNPSLTPEEKQSAIDCTLEWGRLSPFPDSIAQFSITVEGNMFTRSFRTSFAAQPSDIEQWLQQSPGTREASLTTPSPGIRHFEIKPGGGAQRAEVTVDDTTNRVSIYVAWS